MFFLYSQTNSTRRRVLLGWLIVFALLLSVNAQALAASVYTAPLAQGKNYETTLYVIESGKPGPVVLVTGGVHGNESAGYTAAAQIKNWNITRGKLLVIPQVNQLAIKNDVRSTSALGDLNRSFPTTKNLKASNLLAQDIIDLIGQYKVDWVIDLHEGYDYSIKKSTNSVGQSVIYYPSGNTYSLAKKISNLHNQTILDKNKKFVLLKYPVKGSLARSAAVVHGAQSMILETCTKDPLKTRVNYHLNAVQLILTELKMQ